jgi:hypothetical protein
MPLLGSYDVSQFGKKTKTQFLFVGSLEKTRPYGLV